MVSTCMRREARLHRGVPAHLLGGTGAVVSICMRGRSSVAINVPAHLLGGHARSAPRSLGRDALHLWETRDRRRFERLHAGQGDGRSAGKLIYLYIYLYLRARLDQVGGQHLWGKRGAAAVVSTCMRCSAVGARPARQAPW